MNKRAKPTWLLFYALVIGAFVISNFSPASAGTVTNQTTAISYSTLEVALTAAGTGDVLLAEGLFDEYNIRWSQYNNVTLKASTETSLATIDANWLGRAITVEYAVNMTIEGMTITRGRTTGGNGAGIFLPGGSNLTLNKVVIKYCTAESGCYGGAIYTGNNSSVINASNCWFVCNKADYGGVACNGIWNTSNSVYAKNYSSGNGGVAYSATNVTWTSTNCVYAYNSAPNYGGVWYTFKPTGLNNIIWGNSAATDPVWGNVTLNLPIRYSDIQPNTGSFTWPSQTGNISFEPRFASTSELSPNFMLLNVGSRLVDAGSMESRVPTSDAAGYKRPRNTLADIGAYEFRGPSVKLLSPLGGGSYPINSNINITWIATDENGMRTSPLPILIRYSTNEGGTWNTIGGYEANDGLLAWTAPMTITSKYLISIEAFNILGESNYDVSPATFEITPNSTIYVSPSGSDDAGTGSITAPLKTINKAVNSVSSGGQVLCFGGKYSEGNITWPARNNITIKPSNEAAQPVTIEGNAGGRLITVGTAVNLTIESMTLMMMNGGSNVGGVSLPDLSHLWLKKVRAVNFNSTTNGGFITCATNKVTVDATQCTFEGNVSSTVNGGGGVGYQGLWNVNSSTFTKNMAVMGSSAQSGGGVALGGIWKINNCTFISNEANNNTGASGGIAYASTWEVSNSIFHLNKAIMAGGIMAYSTFTTTNCAFSNNSSVSNGGLGDTGIWRSTNCTFYNCTGGSGAMSSNVTGTYYNNIFYLSPMNYYSYTFEAVNRNIFNGIDPNFRSTVKGDPNYLRLKGPSLAIDSGTLTGITTRDLAGNVRPHGLRVDLGAYEFQGPSVSVEYPVGGEVLYPGQTVNIRWKATDEIYGLPATPIKIRGSINNGKTWSLITGEISNSGSYPWTIPFGASNQCLISIEAINGSSEWNIDTSRAACSILAPFAFVSPSGSDDAGTGSSAAPLKTINKAVNSVSSEGYVVCFGGKYTEGNISWPARSNITLMPSDEAALQVTIECNASGRLITVGSAVNLAIQSMTLKMANGGIDVGGIALADRSHLWLDRVRAMNFNSTTNGGFITCATNNVTIDAIQCMFDGNVSSTVNGGGGVGYQGLWNVNGCAFIKNMAVMGSSAQSGGGVALGGIWEVNGCIFTSNEANNNTGASGGIAYGSTWEVNLSIFNFNKAIMAGGIMAYSDFMVTNCEFSNNSSVLNGGIGDNGTWEATNCTFYNCSSESGAMSSTVTGAYYNNIFYLSFMNGYGSTFDMVNRNIFNGIDPNFISTVTGDPKYLMLKGPSLAIDSGTSMGSAVTDLAGNLRIHGFRIDLGAYEYQGPSVSVEYPVGGEELYAGQIINIRWKAVDEIYGLPGTPINIRGSINNGKTWSPIAEGVANSGSRPWTVPNLASNQCLISIEAINASSEWNIDTSKTACSILAPLVYVSPSGSDDAGTGSSAAPFLTINKAVNSVSPEGQVLCFGGKYTEGDITWPARNNITLKPSNEAAQPVTIECNASGRLITVTGAVNLTIESITLKMMNGWVNVGGISLPDLSHLWLKKVRAMNFNSTDNGGFITCATNNVTIDATLCTFEGNVSTTESGGGGVGYQGSWNVNSCNFISNMAIMNTTAQSGGGVALGGIWKVYGCSFTSNEAKNNTGASGGIAYSSIWEVSNSTFDLNKAVMAGGIMSNSTFTTTNCAFSNNSSVSNGGLGDTGIWRSTNCTFYNCTGGSGAMSANVTGTYYNNIFYLSPMNYYGYTFEAFNCNIFNGINPNFRSTVKGDPNYLRLKGPSLAIDSGTMTGITTRDLAGNVRPHGFRVDLGAYEFQGPSISVEYPNGREVLTSYLTCEVAWLVSGESLGAYVVRYSTNEGASWPIVITQDATAVAGETRYIWTVPPINTSKGLISVEVTGNGYWNYDTCNGTFEVDVVDFFKPIIQIIQPNGGEKLKGGNKYKVTCRATDEPTLSQNITVEVYYTTGEVWYFLGLTREASTGIGTYEWTLPVITTTEGRIRMVASDEAGNRGTAESAATFSIDSSPPTVTVVQPNGGETLMGASIYPVTWIASDRVTQSQDLSIEVYYKLGSTWVPVAATKGSSTGIGTYEWTVPYVNTTEALIRVVAKDEMGFAATDESNSKFSISKTAPMVIMIQPDGGEYIRGGNIYNIMWTATDEVTPFAYLTSEVYYNDGSGIWTILGITAEGLTGIGTYEWFVPIIETTEAQIRVSAKNMAGRVGTDESAGTFNIDSTAPVVIQTIPLNAAINVPVDSNIVITFNDPMKIGTVVTHINPAVPLVPAWNALSSEVTYVPGSKFLSSQVYNMTVDSGAEDKAGNIMSSAYIFAFTTVSDIIPPLVTLEAPNGGVGEVLIGGTQYNISWEATDDGSIPSGAVKLRYSINSGETWPGNIATGIDNTGIYQWTVPYLRADNCRVSVEVRDASNNRGYAVSLADFKISSDVTPIDFPSIEGVYISGRRLIDEDIISKQFVLSAHIVDIHGIVSVEADIDAGSQKLILALASGTNKDGSWSANVSIPAVPERLHVIRIDASNEAGLTDFVTHNARIFSGDVDVIEIPYNYPNPFKPLSSDPKERSTIIQYTLNVDAPIVIIIYDMIGKEVTRMKYASGHEGGRAGINSVSWSGTGLNSQPLGNGMYLYKIIYRDKSIGSGKMVIYD